MRDKLGRFVKEMVPWNKKDKIEKICLSCSKIFFVHPYRAKEAKYCSRKCNGFSIRGKASWNKGKHIINSGTFKSGNKHPNWKGGKLISSEGYVLIKIKNHPFSNSRNYILEHRLVMEQSIGRYLKPSEIVHHIDEDKTNNIIDNLMLFSSIKDHVISHASLRKACV